MEMYRICVGERKRRFSFSNTMTSCLDSRLALPHIRFENATCGRRFFILNTEEEVCVFENTQLRVDGQIRFENATCGRRFFKYVENISVFEKTRLDVDGASVM